MASAIRPLLLSLIVVAGVAEASRDGDVPVEDEPVLDAASLVRPALLSGPDFTVDSHVELRGYMAHFLLDTKVGPLNADSVEILAEREAELPAIDALRCQGPAVEGRRPGGVEVLREREDRRSLAPAQVRRQRVAASIAADGDVADLSDRGMGAGEREAVGHTEAARLGCEAVPAGGEVDRAGPADPDREPVAPDRGGQRPLESRRDTGLPQLEHRTGAAA